MGKGGEQGRWLGGKAAAETELDLPGLEAGPGADGGTGRAKGREETPGGGSDRGVALGQDVGLMERLDNKSHTQKVQTGQIIK